MPISEPTADVATGRLSFGDVAIFTCLAGGIASISTAGVALPVESVSFSHDWLASGAFGESAQASQKTPVSSLASAPVARLPSQAAGHNFAVGVLAEPLQKIDVASTVIPAPARIVQPRPTALSLVTNMQLGIRDPFGLRLPPVSDAATNSKDAPDLVELAQSSSTEFAPGSVTSPEGFVTAGLTASASALEATPKISSRIAGLGIIEASEVSNFDLGKVRGSVKGISANLAKAPAMLKGNAASKFGSQRDTIVGNALFHHVGLTVAGLPAQSVAVRIGDDMKPSIKVGDLLGLVAAQLDSDTAARFTAAASAQDYVSLATLREAGFSVTYNAAADSISISAGS